MPKPKASHTKQQQLDFTTLLAGDLSGPAPQKSSYSVSEITTLLEEAIEAHPALSGSMVIQGEVSNVKRSSRGHVYFTLKDEGASISCILWASTANRLNFELQDGLEVYLTGRLEIYRPSGNYSIVGSKMEPVGVGALQLAFQQIKAQLEAEGLFMEEFKKEIPEFPQRIGLITSSTGAVIHDMLRVIRRKNPMVDVLLRPVKVQGEGAAQEIAAAIRELNHPQYQLDILIVGRGGGSFEDLFCFSEEAVVRAVFESDVPVITGIGHEPDYALADAAADYSASTPTAAADWAVPDLQAIIENHTQLSQNLLESMAEVILYHEQTLDLNATRMVELHESYLETCGHQLLQKQERLLSRFDLAFQKKEQQLAEAAAVLNALNPLTTLARGYGVATDLKGQVIQSIQQVKTGDAFKLRLADGALSATISETHPIGAAPAVSM
ncbi:exodeoxyribonuclease VII large subunit [Vampirovibrio sp.]|uniref:exodeoxyribonuclease VII large subunit n=1 Tax=Vampirovibrio sp. TaxID=2717857 RepID=UPI0035938DD6